jgi:competence protein ComEA
MGGMKHLSLTQQWVLLPLALLMLTLLCFKFYPSPSSPLEALYPEVAVELAGEIRNPGIYFFQSPPTLKETLERAGGEIKGTLPENDLLFEIVETGTLITVTTGPQEMRVLWGKMEARKRLALSIPLDLNRAPLQDLCLIPGIGEATAREIVTYRQRRRGFGSVEELKNVKGIGEKSWKTLEPFLVVNP